MLRLLFEMALVTALALLAVVGVLLLVARL